MKGYRKMVFLGSIEVIATLFALLIIQSGQSALEVFKVWANVSMIVGGAFGIPNMAEHLAGLRKASRR